MWRLAIAGTVLLACVSSAQAAGPQDNKRVSRGAVAATGVTLSGDELRGRVVDIQQTLDRILAETTPAPVGTSGTAKAVTTDTQTTGSTAVTVDRARLLQLRRQLDALLGALNKQ